MIPAIILAAGKSERMGTPKALLPLGATTFLQRILDSIAASAAACEVVIVVGHHRTEIQQGLPSGRFVFNPNYEQGMITSIQAGIRAIPSNAEGALLFLVDHPMTGSATIDALIRSFRPGHIILPTFKGRRGHPVLFARGILDEILDLPASAGANSVVWKDPARIIEVAVDDPGIRIDIDTPEQFKELSS